MFPYRFYDYQNPSSEADSATRVTGSGSKIFFSEWGKEGQQDEEYESSKIKYNTCRINFHVITQNVPVGRKAGNLKKQVPYYNEEKYKAVINTQQLPPGHRGNPEQDGH